MKLTLLFTCLIFTHCLFSQQPHFPETGKWAKKDPASSGFDTAKLNDAIRFAIAREHKNPRDMEKSQAINFGKEPHSEPIGLFAERGNPSGVIVHRGYIIAEWGEPARVDMTHSVTKSFLSAVIGLAHDKGLIKNINDKVADYVNEVELFDPPAATIQLFSSVHNKKISWDVMLRQTSDWEGTLWGKPDWADRPDPDSTTWRTRKRNEPGDVFEYNDVRVNALALATSVVWKKSLPQVLEEFIMKPIGATSTWQWHGYRNSWIILDGNVTQSVSGGGHWGGGMFINAYDMARFGLLTLHDGNWNGQQILSKKWMEQSVTPTPAKTNYGFMNYYLNTDKKFLPAAPASAFIHQGNGANIIYVDKEHDLIMVVRWIENRAIPEIVRKVLEAMK